MLIDVSIQTNGVDYRQLGSTVYLPPDVLEVRYNPSGSTRAVEQAGDRPKLARLLRSAGYTVQWSDQNPAVALASRVSPARSAASRRNGKQSHGRPRVKALLAKEPILSKVARLDKGELADLVYLLWRHGVPNSSLHEAIAHMREQRARVAGVEASSAD